MMGFICQIEEYQETSDFNGVYKVMECAPSITLSLSPVLKQKR